MDAGPDIYWADALAHAEQQENEEASGGSPADGGGGRDSGGGGGEGVAGCRSQAMGDPGWRWMRRGSRLNGLAEGRGGGRRRRGSLVGRLREPREEDRRNRGRRKGD